jgi:uncharacterized protein YxjI
MKEELIDNDIVGNDLSSTLNFPIDFKFKIGTLANDFIATDTSGSTIAYVRQKMFKLKEDILIYDNDRKENVLFRIKADRWIDFNACYSFSDGNDNVFGKIGRKGMKSFWKASYELFNTENEIDYHIQEENPWAKVGDALLSEIPLLGILTGYFFHPKYTVKDNSGKIVARLSKESSFFGRKFKLEKVADINQLHSERIMLSFMMMVLLEKRRG